MPGLGLQDCVVLVCLSVRLVDAQNELTRNVVDILLQVHPVRHSSHVRLGSLVIGSIPVLERHLVGPGIATSKGMCKHLALKLPMARGCANDLKLPMARGCANDQKINHPHQSKYTNFQTYTQKHTHTHKYTHANTHTQEQAHEHKSNTSRQADSLCL
jgi:hypothetical protein